jgi:hypothetical protein
LTVLRGGTARGKIIKLTSRHDGRREGKREMKSREALENDSNRVE